MRRARFPPDEGDSRSDVDIPDDVDEATAALLRHAIRYHRHHHHHRHRGMRRRRWRAHRWAQVPLQRRIFFWFGLLIAATSAVLRAVSFLPGTSESRWIYVVAGLGMVWAGAGIIARRLGRPLEQLARVAKRIGDGDLQARAGLDCRTNAEVSTLAIALDDMAMRIEEQLRDQRALLAGVSHELRSPLARLRLVATLLREQGPSEKMLDDLELEVIEMDALVGQLLASARLDFSLSVHQTLDARDLSLRALSRAGLDASLLLVHAGNTQIAGDPTLLARALDNLLENARVHGDGAVRLVVQPGGDAVVFVDEDGGPGLPVEEPVEKLFSPFVRGAGATGGLGLGLSLVKRIALAHKGDVIAERREGGGARVGFSVSRDVTASR